MKILTWSRSFVVLCAGLSAQLQAQNTPTLVYENSHNLYTHKTLPLTNAVTAANVAVANPIATPFTANIVMPGELAIQQRKIINAVFLVKANLGDNYIYGPQSTTTNAPLNFKYRVSFNLKAYNGSTAIPVFDAVTYQLIIENNKPEAVFVRNFTQFHDLGNNAVGGSDFAFQRFAIENVTITPITTAATVSSTQADMLAKIANAIRFEIAYDIEYGVDAASVTTKPAITALSGTIQSAKQITFTWNNNGFEFPNYEFQLLRLYNKSATTSVTEKKVTSEIDWSKALRIETQSNKTSLTLTIAEATGFYVWRVRPIGTFYEGGIANNLNFSESGWSVSPTNTREDTDTDDRILEFASTLTVVRGNGTSESANSYFYYEDSSSDKNWIYSRTFTEGNKMSEEIVYATPLQQIRQTQTYSASKDSTGVTHIIQDNAGRPALTAMDVPVPGKLDNYKKGFVQTEGATPGLYTAKDFDTETNYKQPAKVNQNNTAFSYYSNQNKNTSIPDAEGYPFQRTIYSNDGSERVKEQSGVGKTHMIGDGTSAQGGGKTTKTYYSTPSASELIRLFGDEAPAHESVLKTITVDPNNTASVTYTNKEGNVIATGLSFQDGESTVLEPLNNQPASTPQPVDDAITRNISSEKGFVSSKRIALLQATPLDISYKVKCQDLENSCLDLTLDCRYKVRVIIHNVDRPELTISLPEKDLSSASVSCVADGAGVRYKSVDWPQQTVSPGTYIIEKILVAGDPTIIVDDARTKAEKQLMPLVKRVTSWLEGVDCEEELQGFYTNLNNLAAKVNAAATNPNAPCNSACVVAEFQLGDFEITSKHNITINSVGGKPDKLVINSPCCSNMTVSVAYIAPFRCPSSFVLPAPNSFINDNIFSNPSATRYFPDFEGYALTLLKDVGITKENLYDTYMKGWNAQGEFNRMVYRMLTDKYNGKAANETDNPEENGNPTPAPVKDDCGNVTNDKAIDCTGNLCTQYSCGQLVECWTQQIVALRNALVDTGAFTESSAVNVSDSTDRENGDGGGKHDSHFNDNFKDVKLSRRKKRKLKKKISAMMREDVSINTEAPLTPVNMHLVRDFLECTGYNFAKILTDADPTPLPEDVSRYAPPEHWDEEVLPDGKSIRDYFPLIKDPIYAFKYFYYPETARKRDVELLTCYSDPNDCYKLLPNGQPVIVNGARVKIPCCFERDANGNYSAGPLCESPVVVANGLGNHSEPDSPTPTYNRKYYVKEFCDKGKVVCELNASGWSNGMRYTFYNMIKNAVPVVVDEEEDDNGGESCSDYTTLNVGIYNEETNPIGLEQSEYNQWVEWTNNAPFPSVVQYDMKKMTKDCEGRCEERKAEFRSALILTFTMKGYIIGGCKTSSNDNVIPEEDIDLLVEELYQKCLLQCPVTTFKCEERVCRTIEKSAIEVGHTYSSVEIEYGVGGCAGGCPTQSVPNCTDNLCVSGNCGASTVLSRCEQRKWKQVMEWDFKIDLPSMTDGPDPDTLPDGTRAFICAPSPNMADYLVVPNSFNKNGAFDPNNIHTGKTVSPGIEVNLSLPAQN